MISLGFTPGFGAADHSPNAVAVQAGNTSKEYFQNISPFRVDLVDVNQPNQPQFKGMQGKKIIQKHKKHKS